MSSFSEITFDHKCPNCKKTDPDQDFYDYEFSFLTFDSGKKVKVLNVICKECGYIRTFLNRETQI